MAWYAVINNSIVENIIVADSLEIAEELSGKMCVLASEEPGVSPHIGLSWSINDGFEQPAYTGEIPDGWNGEMLV
jgi:hypothetical protein